MSMDPIRLQLEVRRTGEPIEGRIIDKNDEPVAFTGWLELIAAIEAARAGTPGRSPPDREPSPHPDQSRPRNYMRRAGGEDVGLP